MKRGSSGDASWSITQALWLSVCALTAVAYVGCGGGGSSTPSLIGGTVVVGGELPNSLSVMPSSTPIPGALVWLEQQSHSATAQGDGTVAVENLIQTTTADTNGKFQFGTVPQGTYEIVADTAAMPTAMPTPSSVTISTGVQVTPSGGPTNLTIPLVAESGSAALIQGLFTSNIGITITYAGVQSVQPFGTFLALIPLFSGPGLPTSGPGLPSTTTSPFPVNCTCPPYAIFCACYEIELPASNLPVIGAANSSGTGYFVLAGGEASYSIDAAAYKLNSATADCSTSEFVTAPFTAGSSPPTTAVPEILEFTGCD